MTDLVGTFAQDRWIVVWDLYNEPGNGMGDKSQPLMEAAFAWAREMKPIQPLTTGAWTDFSSPLSHRIMELSDIVSFHGYDPVPEIEAKLKICAAYGRPVLCTEWLVARRLISLGLPQERAGTEPLATRHPARRRHALQRPGGPVHQSNDGQVASQRDAPANIPGADRGKIPRPMALYSRATGRRLVPAGLQ